MRRVSTKGSPEPNTSHIDYPFIIKWILVNSLGGLAISFIYLLVYLAIYPHSTQIEMAKNPVTTVIQVTLVGWLQWLLLRSQVDHIKAWVPLTTIGVVGGYILVFILFMSGIKLGHSVHPFLGFAIGFAQYQILGRRFHRASWWIVGTTIGWFLTQEIGGEANVAIQYLVRLITPTITGFTLAWLLHHPLPIRKKTKWRLLYIPNNPGYDAAGIVE